MNRVVFFELDKFLTFFISDIEIIDKKINTNPIYQEQINVFINGILFKLLAQNEYGKRVYYYIIPIINKARKFYKMEDFVFALLKEIYFWAHNNGGKNED